MERRSVFKRGEQIVRATAGHKTQHRQRRGPRCRSDSHCGEAPYLCLPHLLYLRNDAPSIALWLPWEWQKQTARQRSLVLSVWFRWCRRVAVP